LELEETLGNARWAGEVEVGFGHPCAKLQEDTIYSPERERFTYFPLMVEAGLEPLWPSAVAVTCAGRCSCAVAVAPDRKRE
jgi:hypothetical protein